MGVRKTAGPHLYSDCDHSRAATLLEATACNYFQNMYVHTAMEAEKALYSPTIANAPHATVPQWWLCSHVILVAYLKLIQPIPASSCTFICYILSKTPVVLVHFATESIIKTAPPPTLIH